MAVAHCAMVEVSGNKKSPTWEKIVASRVMAWYFLYSPGRPKNGVTP
jgi:hypothetical protein